jgi:hypothetical protein
VSESIASLPIAFFTIDILINNAGNAHGLDPIQTGDLDDWDAMIDINVKACYICFESHHSQNDRKKIRSYHQYWFHCRKEVYPNGNVVPQNMRLMPKSRHANGFKPLRNKRALSIPEWCKLNLAKCVLRRYR